MGRVLSAQGSRVAHLPTSQPQQPPGSSSSSCSSHLSHNNILLNNLTLLHLTFITFIHIALPHSFLLPHNIYSMNILWLI